MPPQKITAQPHENIRLVHKGDVPRVAMVLGAGKGTRMRPLTDDRPKALVKVGDRTLIDRTLDRLVDAGIDKAVINLHYFGDKLRRHLEARTDPKPDLIWSDETDQLMDTGGGVKKALDLVGPAPFFVINCDIIWTDALKNTLGRLGTRWNPDAMDALLLMAPTPDAVGYDGKGDFLMDPAGRMQRKEERWVAPFVFAGVQLLHPRLFDSTPEGPFSLNLLYDRAEEAGRLFGLRHEGQWLHVGTPEGVSDAEAALQKR